MTRRRALSAARVAHYREQGYLPLGPVLSAAEVAELVAEERRCRLPFGYGGERNGCLWIAPGSQRLGLLEHDPAGVNPVLREARAASPGIPLPLAAGEAVAFTGLTLHASGPNRSGEPRPGLFVRYCEPHARMRSEGDRPVLEDPHSWMVAGEAG